MKQVQTVAALCAVLLVAQAVSADPAWFNPETSSQSKAKTSSYYADALETELSCLSQQNFRSCRFTGFNPGLTDNIRATASLAPRIGDLSVQTDFGCCSKEHRHGHREDIGMVGADGKIGTCDWSINLYWWNYIDTVINNNNIYDQTLAPVLTADGSAVKFGTVTGTCYFSSAAEQCDHPLCERMVLSFNGGLYVSRAYGFVQGPQNIADGFFPQFAPSQDSCANPYGGIGLTDWPFFGPGFNRKAGSQGKSAKSTPAAKQGGTTLGVQEQEFLPFYLSELMAEGMHYLGADPCMAGKDCRPAKAADTPVHKPSQPVGAQEKVKASMANADYAYAPEEKTYAGYAMVVSGPFSVVSANDNQIKQTGIMEFAPTFLATPTGTGSAPGSLVYTPVRPTNKWPIIRGQTAKLRFTKEREEQYSNKDAYQGEGKDSYNAHEPDRKDAYYGNGDNKDYGREYYREAHRS